MGATMNGHYDVMRELIDHGANLDATSALGRTALWWARVGDDEEAVRILLAAGAVAEGRAAREGEVRALGANVGKSACGSPPVVPDLQVVNDAACETGPRHTWWIQIAIVSHPRSRAVKPSGLPWMPTADPR
jgi:ankyrin repeat protein